MEAHHKPEAERLGKRILHYRNRKNITHLQLSVICNCCTKTISRIENGETLPGYGCLIDMASAFGISLQHLVSHEPLLEEAVALACK